MADKREDIFNAGRELFYLKGFKDTNVSEITKMAGIGVGTFYNYFSSKEALFLEVYINESEKHKLQVMNSLDLNEEPVILAKKLIEHNINAMKSNRILNEWNNKDLIRELEQYYREEGSKKEDFFQSFYREIIKKWRAEGKIRKDISEELLLAFFDTLEYIDTHKEDIGIQHFPQLMQYLAEFIMKGLTDYSK